MAKKRVDFKVKKTGTVNSVYVWVGDRNVKLRNNKGHRMLDKRKTPYDVVYLARGVQGSKVEVIASAGDTELGKKKSTLNSNGKSSRDFEITVS